MSEFREALAGCEAVEVELLTYDLLDAAERGRVDAHVAGCVACRTRMAAMAMLDAELATQVSAMAVSVASLDVRAAVQQRIEIEDSAARFWVLEALEVLAMGAVVGVLVTLLMVLGAGWQVGWGMVAWVTAGLVPLGLWQRDRFYADTRESRCRGTTRVGRPAVRST